MKRILLLLAATCVACTAAAQTTEAFPSYIQVTGRAEKEVTPDEFYLSIIINERDSKGKISVESQRNDMIAALKKLGINIEKQLKVANLSSEFFKKKSSVAQAKYQLQLSTAAEVSKVWQALDALNISNVSIAKVTHSKLSEFKEEVRIAAIRNARENAQTLAAAIGQQIGKCFFIYDSNNDIVPRYYNNKMMARSVTMDFADAEAAIEEEETLEFKTIKLEYNVQAKFVLE